MQILPTKVIAQNSTHGPNYIQKELGISKGLPLTQNLISENLLLELDDDEDDLTKSENKSNICVNVQNFENLYRFPALTSYKGSTNRILHSTPFRATSKPLYILWSAILI